MSPRAVAVLALALVVSLPLGVNVLAGEDGITAYERFAELGELEEQYGEYEVGANTGELSFNGRQLHHMELGEGGALAGFPKCSEVVGLGLLGLANQLGVAPQDIGIVGLTAQGNAVAVPPDRARRLCGREWDWIEAVGRG